MSPTTNDAEGPPRREDDRYAELTVQDDALLIYDVRNHCAWIRCDDAVSLLTML